MTISATIIEDSVSQEGKRLTTFLLRYPRFIHAEAKTHRVITIDGVVYEETIDMGFMDDPNLSRNASSSRAIPVNKMIEDLRRDPAMPVYWGSNQPGMQAGAELTDDALAQVKYQWLESMHEAISRAQKMIHFGLHKQIANRILEPWAHINVVVTATDFDNFYQLRRHSDAQPEIKALADAMWLAQDSVEPKLLLPGEWHLPFANRKEDWKRARYLLKKDAVTDEEPMYDEIVKNILLPVSVARCARVSYLTHDGRPTTLEEDMKLYHQLVGSRPLHASPAEHQATPDNLNRYFEGEDVLPKRENFKNPHLHGNFTGWVQYRRTLPGGIVHG